MLRHRALRVICHKESDITSSRQPFLEIGRGISLLVDYALGRVFLKVGYQDGRPPLVGNLAQRFLYRRKECSLVGSIVQDGKLLGRTELTGKGLNL